MNPTKQQVQTVIDNLMKVWPQAEKLDNSSRSLDMSDSEVYPECGSPMCVGGWYAVASIKLKKNEYHDVIDEHGLFIDYIQGADQMAKDLGFENHGYLVDWAEENQEIWGTQYGSHMFSGSKAYNYFQDVPSYSLMRIIKHWEGVRDRL